MLAAPSSLISPDIGSSLTYRQLPLFRKLVFSNNYQQSASIKSLPPELLAHIFQLGTHPETPDPDLGGPEDDGSRFEIRVSHVCVAWRKVAISNRGLWTSVVFREMSHLERAEVYLERSGNRTIDILVDTVSVKDHVKGVTLCRNEFDSIFNIVVPHVGRWRSLVLKVRDNVCKAGARKFLSTCGPAPFLETLQLYHFEDWATSQELFLATVRPPVLVFDGVLPRLRNLFLIGVNLPWTVSLTFLKDLEELQLALHSVGVRPSYHEWYSILIACPNLKRLSLHYSGPLASDSWPDEPVPLPKLEELSLIDLDPDYLCRLFEHIALSCVKRLRLELSDQDFTPFINFVSKPNAPIFRYVESLHITALDCSLESWTALLSTMPMLKFLHVDFRRVPKEFCLPLMDLSLVLDPDQGKPDQKGKKKSEPEYVLTCPRLETLKIAALPSNTLQNICRSRADHKLPMSNLYIHEKDRKGSEVDFGCRIHYFRYPEDEEEEDSEYDEEEDIEGDEEEEEQPEEEEGGDLHDHEDDSDGYISDAN